MALALRLSAAFGVLSGVLSVGAVPSPADDITVSSPSTTSDTVSDSTSTTASLLPVQTSWSPKSSQSQQYSPPASFSFPGVTLPTFALKYKNPNGPFYNPNDFVPYYADWPGHPTASGETAPPMPTEAPKTMGGDSAYMYQAPAFQLVGSDMSPDLPQEETNGDSTLGMIGNARLRRYIGAPAKALRRNIPALSSRPKGKPRRVSNPFNRPTGFFNSTPSASRSFGGPTGSLNSTASASRSSIRPTGYFNSTGSISRSPSANATATSTGTCAQSTDISGICGTMPDTGVTRYYDFTIAYGTIAPDGVQKNGLLVNGQFPGPLIEANWGDWISVTVTNNLPDDSSDQGEGTSLHWHGLKQHATPWYDGVPSVGQCPIAPSKTLTYTFRADHIGTSWYHSHYSAQYAGGALGPLVIYGPDAPGACYDEDIGPVMVGDWYHADYFSLVNVTMNGGLPLADNVLINGKMNYPCENTTAVCTPNAGISKFQFEPGLKYRLRLINPSAEAIIKFHIDGHDLTVIANDFIPIQPYTTNVVTLGVGQRSDVIVEASGAAGSSYWMRATAGNFFGGAGCSTSTGVVTEGVAAVYYTGADISSVPSTTSSLTEAQLNRCVNDDLSLTSPVCPVPLEDDSLVTTDTIQIRFASNGTNFVWFMNGSSFRADYNVNLISQVASGNLTFDPDWNVYTSPSSSTSLRIIFKNTFPLSHPMHIHGHDFNVLATGSGTWDGTITNPQNTQVRDTELLPGAGPDGPGYIVLQFRKDNPGVWPAHCHIAWHVSGGLYVNLLEREADIVPVPDDVLQTCVDWAAWEARGNVPDQIDSGL